MKTGIELIEQERWEQINKHGFSLEHDAEFYKDNELVKAAWFCLMLAGYISWDAPYPINWDKHFKDKITSKTQVQQLIVAGAFYMAENERAGNNNYNKTIQFIASEIDRLQNLNNQL